jgi:predicted membrane channel-forming protein YqfA (hemolysin III family)
MRWLEAVILLSLLVLLTASTVLDAQDSAANRQKLRRLGMASIVLLIIASLAMTRRLLDLL